MGRAQRGGLGQHDHDGCPPEPPDHVQQALERGRVRVVEVVHGDGHRVLVAQAGQRGEHSVQDPHPGGVVRGQLLDGPAGPGEPVEGACQELVGLGGRLRSQRRAVQELPDHTQRKPAFRPGPGGAQHPPAHGGHPLSEDLQQLGLAAAHGPAQEGHLPAPLLLAGTVRPPQPGQLFLALHQHCARQPLSPRDAEASGTVARCPFPVVQPTYRPVYDSRVTPPHASALCLSPRSASEVFHPAESRDNGPRAQRAGWA